MTLLPTSPADDAATIADRLEAARVAHRDAQDVATRAAKRFRQLIVEAIDTVGLTRRQVADLSGVGLSRITKIIETEYRRP